MEADKTQVNKIVFRKMDRYRLVNVLMKREDNILHCFAVQLPKSFTDSLLLRLARNTIAMLRPSP